MSDRFPSKPITLDNYKFLLSGISADDAYWQGIADNFEPEFQRFCRRLISTGLRLPRCRRQDRNEARCSCLDIARRAA